LEKMEAAAKNDPAHSGGWIKTHPAASSRIAQLKPMLKQYAANKNAPETERRWLKYKGML